MSPQRPSPLVHLRARDGIHLRRFIIEGRPCRRLGDRRSREWTKADLRNGMSWLNQLNRPHQAGGRRQVGGDNVVATYRTEVVVVVLEAHSARLLSLRL